MISDMIKLLAYCIITLNGNAAINSIFEYNPSPNAVGDKC